MSHNVPIRPSLSLFIFFQGLAWNNNCNGWNNNKNSNCNCKDKMIAIKSTWCRKLWDAIYYNWDADRTRLETLCRSIRSTERLKAKHLMKTNIILAWPQPKKVLKDHWSDIEATLKRHSKQFESSLKPIWNNLNRIWKRFETNLNAIWNQFESDLNTI